MGLLSQHVERTLSMMRERTLKKENVTVVFFILHSNLCILIVDFQLGKL